MLLKPRSLLVILDSEDHEMVQGIKSVKEDIITDTVANLEESDMFGRTLERSTRVSLTIR